VVELARLESVYGGNVIEGSNPSPSAILRRFDLCRGYEGWLKRDEDPRFEGENCQWQFARESTLANWFAKTWRRGRGT
jgi:hypothetical protein